MRLFMIIILAGLLAGCASSGTYSPRQKAKPYDPTVPRSPSGCIPVIVSFAGDEWMDMDELKYRAKQRLQAEGHPLDDSYQCWINVELISRSAGCMVWFSKGFGQPVYRVEFNREGEVRNVTKSIAVEGQPGMP